jgi:Uma2 family endonuclease
MDALTLQLPATAKLSDEQFYELCLANRDLRIERSPTGALILMPPTGGETGQRNARLSAQLWIWNQNSGLGEVFDSSGGFNLPKGGVRTADSSWVTIDRWNALTSEQKEKFPPMCPDFVVELLSLGDRLTTLQAKMQEYISNGVRLGWLINRQDQQVEIYRPNKATETLQNPLKLLGEDVLPGFELDLSGIL